MKTPAQAMTQMFLDAIDMDKAVDALAGPPPNLYAASAQDLDECSYCDGQGAYWDDQTGQPDSFGGSMVTCHVCGGEGVVDTSPCIECGAPMYDHEDECSRGAK